MVAKVEWHPGELHPRVGSIVTNLSRSAERVTWFYNQRGKAEQYIKEGKNAIKWTRLSCRKFRDNAVRLQLHALTLQSRQLHADTGLAEGSRALVDDDITREAGENRWQGCPTWPLRHLINWPKSPCPGTCFGKSCGGSMNCDEDPLRRRPREIDGEDKATGGVCLNGGKSGQMAFQTRAYLQNHAIGWLQRGCSSLGGGTVVRFPGTWMASGECRLRELERLRQFEGQLNSRSDNYACKRVRRHGAREGSGSIIDMRGRLWPL